MAKYILGKEFTQFIAKNTIGYLTTRDLDKLLSLIESEFNRYHFTKNTELNFLRILESQFDKTKLISEFINYPHRLEILTNVSVNSNYLTDILIVHPEFIDLILNQELLTEKLSQHKLNKEIERGVNRLKSIRGKINLLKSFKMRYLLKIGVNDLLGNYTLQETTYALSVLAKELLSSLFNIVFNEIQNKYGVDLPNDYVLLALGKLGGRELNYSSDVDLIALYKSNYKVAGKEYHEIFTEAITAFIKYSSVPDERGYLYRIDFRLRPDGKSSPLCRTYSDTIHYYESRGEDWERQMLIKLNLLCGNENLYSDFRNVASKFIFQSYSISSIKEQTRKMKKAIEENMTGESNVKLFAGGIRDIEFITQALQLINGKKFANFFTGNTLQALHLLKEQALINEKEYDILVNAYVFYRRIEHYLQLMNDRQTHDLPEDNDVKKRLSMFMGFKSTSSFMSKLTSFRTEVRKIFNLFVGEEAGSINLPFTDIKRAKSNLAFLRTGKGPVGSKEFDRKTIVAFEKIENRLLEEIGKVFNPEETLENLVTLVKATPLPSIFYSQCESKLFLEYVISICSKNKLGIELINNHPALSEIIVSTTFLSDDDYIINNLTTEQFLVYLSSRAALNLININDLPRILSKYLLDRIIRVYEKESEYDNLIIYGYGSFAIREMNLFSDIDLALFAINIDEIKSPQAFAINLSKKIKKELNPFDVDFRLRPEGQSSQLLWDYNSYLNYLKERARIWELQSILKATTVVSSNNQIKDIRSILIRRLKDTSEDELKSEMLSMYRKLRSSTLIPSRQINLKQAHGGLTTIDFIISYLLFKNLETLEEAMGESTQSKINILINHYPDFQEQLKQIEEWHNTIKHITLAVNILFNRNKSFIYQNNIDELERINGLMNFNCSIESIQNQLKHTGDFFNKLFLE